MPIKILFIGLDYQSLDLPGEVQTIMNAIRSFGPPELFEVQTEWCPTMRSLSGVVLRHAPHFIHISGHGENGRLQIADGHGGYRELTPSALSGLLQIENGVRCVVLNACDCLDQARILAEFVDHVVGVDGKIEDEYSIEFSIGFYQALAMRRDIPVAFQYGRQQVAIHSPDSARQFEFWSRPGVLGPGATAEELTRALADFFREAFSFSPGELRERIGYLPNGLALKRLLPSGNAPIDEVARAASNILVERRALRQEWLDELAKFLPGHRRTITKLAAMWAELETSGLARRD